MRTFGRAVIGALLGLQALSPVPASAFSSSGGTAVEVDGSVVTITVTIDLMVGGAGTTELPEGAQQVVDSLASDIESYWNQGFARYGTPCLELRLDVIINALPNTLPPPSILDLGEDRSTAVVTEPGHHVIFYGEGNAYGNIPPPETYDPYDDDGVAPPGEDFGSPFDHELWAIWSPYLEDNRDFAHELGHLLGLGDDYANGTPLPGREGTLMAYGDLIDQNLVNRLADLARGAGNDLPECWEGTYSGTVTWDCGPIGERSGTLDGTVTINVAQDRTATMSIQHTVTGSCSGPEGTLTTPIEAVGERTPTGFEFAAFFGGAGSIVIAVDGDRGTGEFTGPVPGPATVSVTFDIEKT